MLPLEMVLLVSTVIPEGNNGEEQMVQMYRIDSNYLKTFGLTLADGRFLGRGVDFNPGTMVVNEAFVKQAGWENPLERTIQFSSNGAKYPIVGVLKDFNFSSLHQEVSPVLMYLDERLTHTSVRIEPAQLTTLLPQMKKLWAQFENRRPFDYYFVDEFFAQKYQAEQQMLTVITLFALLAIFIACLGLYGLATYAIARRRKEIGVRKVLGASIISLIGLLSARFIKLVVIALVLAIPIVYYYTNDWLNGFAYRVNLSWWVFILAGLSVLGIVLLTISIQSVKAAIANPIHSLKSE